MCNLLVRHEWLWGMRANGVAWEPSYNNSRLASQHISSTMELCNKSEEKHQRKCIYVCVFRPCLHYLWYFCKNLFTAFAPVSNFELMFLEKKTEQNTVLMKFFFFFHWRNWPNKIKSISHHMEFIYKTKHLNLFYCFFVNCHSTGYLCMQHPVLHIS